jgi:hypothetical protein
LEARQCYDRLAHRASCSVRSPVVVPPTRPHQSRLCPHLLRPTLLAALGVATSHITPACAANATRDTAVFFVTTAAPISTPPASERADRSAACSSAEVFTGPTFYRRAEHTQLHRAQGPALLNGIVLAGQYVDLATEPARGGCEGSGRGRGPFKIEKGQEREPPPKKKKKRPVHIPALKTLRASGATELRPEGRWTRCSALRSQAGPRVQYHPLWVLELGQVPCGCGGR